MRYAVVVDPAVLQDIEALDPPQRVRDAVADGLAELECEDSRAQLYELSSGRTDKLVGVWCDGHYHRYAFAVDVQDDTGVVWVMAVAANPP